MSKHVTGHNFVHLASPMRITEQIWPEQTVPLLSITCIAYNHVSFICQAIEGFLMQETTFPVEILIYDDASSDGTTKIIRNYEYMNPHLIKTLFQEKNKYSEGEKPGNFLRHLQRGKYLAFCEGDDYWTDPKKLQIQVDYLESHPECVVSGHDSFVIDALGNTIKYSVVRSSGRDYSSRELQKGMAILPYGSRLLRNLSHQFHYPLNSCYQGDDIFQLVVLGKHGSSHFHNDISPSAYRIHSGGVWSSMDRLKKNQTAANNMYFIQLYFLRQGDTQLVKHWGEQWERRAIKAISMRSIFFELCYRIIFFEYLKDFILLALGRKRIEKAHLYGNKFINIWRLLIQRK